MVRSHTKKKNNIGKDAVVSIFTKYLHPSKLVKQKFPNAKTNHRLSGLKVVRLEQKIVSRRPQLAVVVVHDDFKSDGESIELHAVPRWFRVDEEGPKEYFFESTGERKEPEDEQEKQVVLSDMIINRVNETRSLTDENIQEIVSSGIPVDDDNNPLEENVPKAGEPHQDVFASTWGHDGICYRRQSGAHNLKAKLMNFPNNILPTPVQLFEHFFPKPYLVDVLLAQTNSQLKNESFKITYGELLRYLGMWFHMATTNFENRRDFWSTKPINSYNGAPWRYNEVMSRQRFENITSALSFTDLPAPAYKDRFWEVRQLQDEWNKNMDEHFASSWISVLDESMSKWLNEYTCPGFMCVPRKPWPLGNEWHSICCAKSGVMYRVELVEGKDRPIELGPKKFEEKGKVVGLLQRLTQPLWHCSKVVILDSGFCVLQGLVELRKRGVFAAALIKKRRYWPKHIQGDAIKNHFATKEVGDVDAWPGVLDGVRVHIFAMKEPDYVMSLMSTYGTLVRGGEQKERNYKDIGGNKRRRFFYPELIVDYFSSRDKVDSHNGSRMFPIALEETWKTKRWPCRVFQFLLAITEVNMKLISEYYYGCDKTSMLDFRKRFAKEMIYNIYLEQENKRRSQMITRCQETAHSLESLAPFSTFRGSNFARCKTRYIQLRCSSCPKRVRSYCRCAPGIMLCCACYSKHLFEVQENE